MQPVNCSSIEFRILAGTRLHTYMYVHYHWLDGREGSTGSKIQIIMITCNVLIATRLPLCPNSVMMLQISDFDLLTLSNLLWFDGVTVKGLESGSCIIVQERVWLVNSYIYHKFGCR